MRFLKIKRTLEFFLILVGYVGLLIVATLTLAYAQSSDAIADLAARINRERTSRGMMPYALNAQLNAAAQAHADDISRTGVKSHTGSDGSDVRDRVARAGYGAYTWGRRVGENWAYYPDAATAMRMWMDSPPHAHNILHPVYREFGIGIAPSKEGNFIYVIDFGAQPNVLPIFIQADGRDLSLGRMSLWLSNETYATTGDGAKAIGLAKEVQISSSPDFAGAQWQTFAPRFAWTLAKGSKAVYVKFRDERGRTTTSADSVDATVAPILIPTLMATLAPTARPTATHTPRPRPSATRLILPKPTAAGQPRDTPVPTQVAALDTPIPTLVAALEAPIMSDAPVPSIEMPAPLPPESVESIDPREENRLDPIATGAFTLSFLVAVAALVRLFRRGANS